MAVPRRRTTFTAAKRAEVDDLIDNVGVCTGRSSCERLDLQLFWPQI
jgi:hypothetical protein